MANGTIAEFGVDGLGWIDLDEGAGRVRFAYSVCSGLTQEMFVPGTRVVVSGTAPGFRGVIKATGVSPLDPAPAVEAPPAIRRTEVRWEDVVAQHPRFSDVDSVALVPRLLTLPPASEPPSIFAPWRREIERTTPIVVGLQVPDYRAPESIEPTIDDCFSHGNIAFVPQPSWPACTACARPLEMCIQLSAAAIAPWAPGRGGLCAMFCFHCGETHGDDEGVAYVRFVPQGARVTCPATKETASSSPRRETQRVTLTAPRRMLPGSSWYRYRASKSPTTAASVIFTDSGSDLVGLDGFSSLEEVESVFDDWAESMPGAPWGGAVLGGAPNWDQHDATPRCAHGEMKQLLEYDGGQFLDGALHVFICPECPEPRFVAEF